MGANRKALAACWSLALGLFGCLDLEALQGAADTQDAMSVIDLANAADMGRASGCASGSGVLVGRAWACAGIYNANRGDAVPGASELCASGHSLCTSAQGVDLSTCGALPGFFVAAVPLHRPRLSTAPMDLACGAATGSDVLLFAGCGRGLGTEAIFDSANSCAGFSRAIDCSLSSAMTCGTAADLSAAAQYSAASGVLCCPM